MHEAGSAPPRGAGSGRSRSDCDWRPEIGVAQTLGLAATHPPALPPALAPVFVLALVLVPCALAAAGVGDAQLMLYQTQPLVNAPRRAVMVTRDDSMTALFDRNVQAGDEAQSSAGSGMWHDFDHEGVDEN